MPLARIGAAAMRAKVTRIVELDGSDDARVRLDDQKVDGEPAEAVADAGARRTVPEAHHLQQLHLREHDVLGERLHQAPIEHQLRVAEQTRFALERPGSPERGEGSGGAPTRAECDPGRREDDQGGESEDGLEQGRAQLPPTVGYGRAEGEGHIARILEEMAGRDRRERCLLAGGHDLGIHAVCTRPWSTLSSGVRILGSSPAKLATRYYAAVLTAMRTAESSIWITAAYFVPTHSFEDHGR